MNALDWILLGVAIICVVRGIWRGAVSQVFGIAGLCGGFLTAAHYYQGVALRLTHAFPDLSAAPAISFVTLFLLTWFCIGALGFCISKLLHRSGLSFFDRFLGAGIGLGKAALFSIIVISMLTFFLSAENPLLFESYLVPHVQEVAEIAIKATPQSVQQLFDRKRLEIERYWAHYESSKTAGGGEGNNKNKGANIK